MGGLQHADPARRVQMQFWNYSANFHEGLNKLLNESTALPGELFDELSDTDKDTADTHLALGNFYRRRGDINRAILLHESLLEKTELGAQVHSAALLELANDYDSAGLLDRSAETLTRLIDSGERLPEAYSAMLQLLERERDWTQAIAVATKKEQVTNEDLSASVAHYYCELAHSAKSDGYAEEAKALAERALKRFDKSARAHMLLAGLASAKGDNLSALGHYDQVEKLRPALMPDIIDERFEALRKNGDEAALRSFIAHIENRRNAYSVVRTTRTAIEQLDGAAVADRFFKKQILQRPSLKGLRDWAQDQVEISKPGEKEKVQVIHTLLDQVVEDKPGYQCGRCGYLGNTLHWRCPGCNNWDTVQPIIGVEGE